MLSYCSSTSCAFRAFTSNFSCRARVVSLSKWRSGTHTEYPSQRNRSQSSMSLMKIELSAPELPEASFPPEANPPLHKPTPGNFILFSIHLEVLFEHIPIIVGPIVKSRTPLIHQHPHWNLCHLFACLCLCLCRFCHLCLCRPYRFCHPFFCPSRLFLADPLRVVASNTRKGLDLKNSKVVQLHTFLRAFSASNIFNPSTAGKTSLSWKHFETSEIVMLRWSESPFRSLPRYPQIRNLSTWLLGQKTSMLK